MCPTSPTTLLRELLEVELLQGARNRLGNCIQINWGPGVVDLGTWSNLNQTLAGAFRPRLGWCGLQALVAGCCLQALVAGCCLQALVAGCCLQALRLVGAFRPRSGCDLSPCTELKHRASTSVYVSSANFKSIGFRRKCLPSGLESASMSKNLWYRMLRYRIKQLRYQSFFFLGASMLSNHTLFDIGSIIKIRYRTYQ
jgi:hypothetical protein